MKTEHENAGRSIPAPREAKAIWLAPECIEGDYSGRCWSEDDDFEECDCGAIPRHESVKYVLAPVVQQPEEPSHDGYHVRHDIAGYYVCTDEEAEREDKGSNSVGFDGRKHYTTIEHATRVAVAKAEFGR